MGVTVEKKRPFRLTVGMKLGGLISVLLVASVFGLVGLSTRLFVDYNTAQIQQITFDTASSLAVQMRQTFESTTDKMRILGTLLTQEGNTVPDLLAKDTNLLGVFVHQKKGDEPLVLRAQALSDQLPAYDVKDLLSKGFSPESVLKSGDAGTQVFMTETPDGRSVIAISIPLVKETINGAEQFTHTVTALIGAEVISKTFTELTSVTSYMVDRDGRLLAHADMARAIAHENVSMVGIVQEFLIGKKSIQKEYADPVAKIEYLGAFKTVGFAGLGVFAELPKARAFEGAERVRRQSLLTAAIILFLSFMLGNYFSVKTITAPILLLAEAANRISKGDFKISLKPRSRDEIGDLALTFNHMAQGLEERDKVKQIFNKFHNEAITKKLLAGEVKLGGEKLTATIFFSDIRGFTSLSESMPAEEVVVMLNEYMSRMVAIIHARKGVVDKYVGDAIMALWGVPITSPDDTENAVMACLEMRQELARLNELRISRGQPALKIGMGLNSGDVIAGNIGSEEKMEYTVIGDTVNVASRVESMTKEYGTDLLVSGSVFERIKDKFIFEACAGAKVKGKSSLLEIHKVTGYVARDGQRVLIQTPYSSYASEKSDKAA